MKYWVRILSVVCLVAGIAVAEPAPSYSPLDLLLAGRVDDAVKVLTTRVHNSPNDAEAYHLLTRAYYHLKLWDQAISNGEKAVQLAPTNSDYYMWLARAYGEKASVSSFWTAAGLTKKIKSNFEKAVELDGRNVDARTDLAEFYIEAPGFMGGGIDKAVEQGKQIAVVDQARAHWVSAKIAEKKKDYETAEREYQEAIKQSQDADYWLNLANFYRKRERWSDLDSAVAKAMSAPSKKTNALYDAATLLYQSQRNLPMAADLLREYLKSVPNEDAPAFQAHQLLAEIMEKQGNKQGAAGEYRATLAMASNYGPAQEGLKRVSN
jgi:tetratricopeptide (TPR) repeat protein